MKPLVSLITGALVCWLSVPLAVEAQTGGRSRVYRDPGRDAIMAAERLARQADLHEEQGVIQTAIFVFHRGDHDFSVKLVSEEDATAPDLVRVSCNGAQASADEGTHDGVIQLGKCQKSPRFDFTLRDAQGQEETFSVKFSTHNPLRSSTSGAVAYFEQGKKGSFEAKGTAWGDRDARWSRALLEELKGE